MAFRSGIDWWLVLILIAAPGWGVAREWAQRGVADPPASLWLMVAVLTVLAVAFIPIRYVIDGHTVGVQCGLFGWEYTAFGVGDIQKIEPTHNPLAAPALSLDRLKIELAMRGTLLISPRDKAGFLRAIEALDPQLQITGNSLLRVG